MKRSKSGPSRLRSQALWLVLVTLLAAFVATSSGQTGPAEAPPFVIIVHASNPATSVDKDRLSKMFLKKIKRWEESGATVEPFDQVETQDVREVFTRAVHGKSISAIKSYWQRMIFSGRDVPPDELDSDADLMSAVAGSEGGVGYVSSSTKLVPGVKAVTISGE